MPTRALRVRDAARAYSLSKTRIYEMIAAGRLKSLKVGGRRLVTVDSLESLLADN
jgi:excisionase family DNA binding protein